MHCVWQAPSGHESTSCYLTVNSTAIASIDEATVTFLAVVAPLLSSQRSLNHLKAPTPSLAARLCSQITLSFAYHVPIMQHFRCVHYRVLLHEMASSFSSWRGRNMFSHMCFPVVISKALTHEASRGWTKNMVVGERGSALLWRRHCRSARYLAASDMRSSEIHSCRG